MFREDLISLDDNPHFALIGCSNMERHEQMGCHEQNQKWIIDRKLWIDAKRNCKKTYWTPCNLN